MGMIAKVAVGLVDGRSPFYSYSRGYANVPYQVLVDDWVIWKTEINTGIPNIITVHNTHSAPSVAHPETPTNTTRTAA